MNKNIEVEGGEIAIQNESGDIAIIPVKDVAKVKKMLKNPSELDSYVAGLPKMSEYAEEGTIINTNVDTDNTKPKVSTNSRLSDFIIDVDNPEVLNEYAKKYARIHKTSNPKRDESGNIIPGEYDQPGCVAGALNCNTDFVAPKLGVSPIRSMLHDKVKDVKNSKYSIPSKPLLALPKDFAPNQSIDAWEMGDVMTGEGIGSYLFEKGDDTEYDKNMPNYPKGLDYSNIPLGAIILQGDAAGEYIPGDIKGKPRHMSTVIGFDKDGVPLTYDYGKIRRITNTMKPITKIVSPKGYENYSYSKMKGNYDKEIMDLGYDIKDTDKEYKYKNESVNNIYKSLDKYDKQIGHDFKIPKDAMEMLKNRVVGIGVKETNLNNTGDEDITLGRELAINLGDSFIGNEIAKPSIKNDLIINSLKTAYNKLTNNYDYSKPEKHDWELEVEAFKLAKGDKELEKKLYNKARSIYPKPGSKPSNRKKNLESSVGAFAIKNLPEYAKNILKIDKSDLYGSTVGTQEEISKGSVVALTHLAENFNKFKEEYKDLNLSNEELVDLVTVAYNNNSKPKSKKFIEYYIKDKGKLSDGYLSSVKEFSEKYTK